MPRSGLLILVLVAIALTSPAQAGEAWSGTIEIVETISGSKPSAGSDAELKALAKQLEARLTRTRERLRNATPTVARALREDLGHLEAEMEQVALERGGTMQLGHTVYRIAGTRVLSDGDEARVLFDWTTKTALLTIGGKRQPVALKDRPKQRMPDKSEDGKEMLGLPTQRMTVRAGGDDFVVRLAAGLPNPYALTLLSEADELQIALAALPGLPMDVESRRGEAVHRYTVLSIEPGAVEVDQE